MMNKGQTSLEAMGVVALVVAIHAATLAYVASAANQESQARILRSLECECKRLSMISDDVFSCGPECKSSYIPSHDLEIFEGYAMLEGNYFCKTNPKTANSTLLRGREYTVRNEKHTVRFT
jgi:hypothetical protein